MEHDFHAEFICVALQFEQEGYYLNEPFSSITGGNFQMDMLSIDLNHHATQNLLLNAIDCVCYILKTHPHTTHDSL